MGCYESKVARKVHSKSQLFSNLINLKQMTLSVTEYSAKFEETRLRCSEFHDENPFSWGNEVCPYLGLDEIGSPSPMTIFIIISYLFNRTFWICLLGFLVGAYI